jgi:hypothetical protein
LEEICQDPYYWARRTEFYFGIPRNQFYAMVAELENRGELTELAPNQLYLYFELRQAISKNDVPRVNAILQTEILEDPILLRDALMTVSRDTYFDIYTMLQKAGAPSIYNIWGQKLPFEEFQLSYQQYNPWQEGNREVVSYCRGLPIEKHVLFLRLLNLPIPQDCRLTRQHIIQKIHIPAKLDQWTIPQLRYWYCYIRSNNRSCQVIQDRLMELGQLT